MVYNKFTILYMNIQTVNLDNLSFVNVVKPGELEIKYLKNNFGFSPLHLDDYINKTQSPKIEMMKDYSLIVVDFPYASQDSHGNPAPQQKTEDSKTAKTPIDTILNLPPAALSAVSPFSATDKKKRIFSSQVDIFIGRDYMVVLHEDVLTPINDIFVNCQKTLQKRKEYMSEGSVFLAYRLIDILVDSCFPFINEVAASIDRIDRELQDRQMQKTLEEISITRRNIVVFQTMIKPIIPLFKQLENGDYKPLNGMMQQYWGNILDHLQKIWDRLEDSRELIEGISSSNESLLTSKTNRILSVLTIIFTYSLPATVIGTFFGMNVLLPGGIEVGHWTFWGEYTTLIIIIIAAIIPALLMHIYFKKGGWF